MVPKAVMTMTGVCEFWQQLQPVHLRQAQIGQHQVGAVGDSQRFLGGAGLLHFKAGGGELQFKDAAQLLFVLDHQDASLHGSGSMVLILARYGGSSKVFGVRFHGAAPRYHKPLARTHRKEPR
jgi:hypothetical protein